MIKKLILEKQSRRAILSGLMMFMVTGCSPLKVINAIVPEGDVIVDADHAYGSNLRQKLDIYRPAKSEAAMPTVVFFLWGQLETGQ